MDSFIIIKGDIMKSGSVLAIIIVTVLLTFGVASVYYTDRLIEQKAKQVTLNGEWEKLINAYDEVLVLQDIRIDQLKTQLEDCTGIYFGVSL